MSNNHIPENVYDNLVKLYINIYHCYIDILNCAKELLGLDDLKMYDLYTPLIKDIKFEMPYEEAKRVDVKSFRTNG